MLRRIIGSVLGIALLGVDRIEAGKILEIVGLASLPSDLSDWRHALIWIVSHLALWVPLALGIGLILWAIWERVVMSLKSQRPRTAVLAVLLVACFFLPLPDENGIAQPTKPGPAAPLGSGSVTIQGGNYGNACTNGAKCEINKTVIDASTSNPNLLYQANDFIGRIMAEPVITKSTVTFNPLQINRYLDPNLPVVFRKMALSCPELDKREQIGNTPDYIGMWTIPVTCKILDPRSVNRK